LILILISACYKIGTAIAHIWLNYCDKINK
jgi:hypothetical protein